jgi:hypothetical protein
MNFTELATKGLVVRRLSMFFSSLLLLCSGCARFDSGSNIDSETCRAHWECTASNAPICGLDGQCRACGGDGECVARDSDFPVCTGGACVAACVEGSAGDAQCLAQDETRPYCVGEACVQCRDKGDCDGRICDDSASVCRDCTEHAQCESGACGRDTGICATEADIIYVDKDDDNANDLGDCTSAMPCQTIAKAVERIVGGLDPGSIIVVRGGASVVYDGALTLDGITVTLVGSGSTIQPKAVGETDRPVVEVKNGAVASIEGFKVTKATGTVDTEGVKCTSNSNVRISRLIVAENAGIGIAANECSLSLERSEVLLNAQGGITVQNSDFRIVNNFVAKNGDAFMGIFGGISIYNTDPKQTQVLSFNTVARNFAANNGEASGIKCSTISAMTAKGNIVYEGAGNAPATSGNCKWEYSNIQGGAPEPNAGEGNIDEQPSFVNPNGSDFHLQPGSPGVDVEGLSSDILIDFDGDARPQNGLFDMGADEVTP